MELKLTIEFIPEKTWGKSLAQLLPKKQWDYIRKLVYKRERYSCQVCQATNCEVHCHEQWTYNDRKHLQILTGLICLCVDCHNIKHWGRTIKAVHDGELTSVYKTFLVQHFCDMNSCSEKDMTAYVVKMGTQNMARSKYQYRIDILNLPELIKGSEKILKKRETL